jgi:hypothetical protein
MQPSPCWTPQIWRRSKHRLTNSSTGPTSPWALRRAGRVIPESHPAQMPTADMPRAPAMRPPVVDAVGAMMGHQESRVHRRRVMTCPLARTVPKGARAHPTVGMDPRLGRLMGAAVRVPPPREGRRRGPATPAGRIHLNRRPPGRQVEAAADQTAVSGALQARAAQVEVDRPRPELMDQETVEAATGRRAAPARDDVTPNSSLISSQHPRTAREFESSCDTAPSRAIEGLRAQFQPEEPACQHESSS